MHEVVIGSHAGSHANIDGLNLQSSETDGAEAEGEEEEEEEEEEVFLIDFSNQASILLFRCLRTLRTCHTPSNNAPSSSDLHG